MPGSFSRIHINTRRRKRLFISAPHADQTQMLESAARIAAIGLFVFALIAVLYFGQYLVMPITVAIILGMTFGPVVDSLEHYRLPAPLGSALLLAGGFACVTALFYVLALPLEQWSTRLPDVWDEVRTEIRQLQAPLEEMKKVEEAVEEAVTSEREGVEVKVQKTGIVTSTVSAAPSAIARFFIFLGTLYFFLGYRRSLRESILRLCVRQRLRLRVAHILRDVEQFLSRYLISIAAINLGFGVVVGLLMFFIGMPSPHLWGVLAAVLNFIPYAGPALMTVILLGVGIAEYDSLGGTLAPALAFLGINFIEAQFITPTVLGRTLTLNPFLIVVSLSFWIWLWGPIGGFLAVPLFLIIKTAVFRTATGSADLHTAAQQSREELSLPSVAESVPDRSGAF